MVFVCISDEIEYTVVQLLYRSTCDVGTCDTVLAGTWSGGMEEAGLVPWVGGPLGASFGYYL